MSSIGFDFCWRVAEDRFSTDMFFRFVRVLNFLVVEVYNAMFEILLTNTVAIASLFIYGYPWKPPLEPSLEAPLEAPP